MGGPIPAANALACAAAKALPVTGFNEVGDRVSLERTVAGSIPVRGFTGEASCVSTPTTSSLIFAINPRFAPKALVENAVVFGSTGSSCCPPDCLPLNPEPPIPPTNGATQKVSRRRVDAVDGRSEGKAWPPSELRFPPRAVCGRDEVLPPTRRFPINSSVYVAVLGLVPGIALRGRSFLGDITPPPPAPATPPPPPPPFVRKALTLSSFSFFFMSTSASLSALRLTASRTLAAAAFAAALGSNCFFCGKSDDDDSLLGPDSPPAEPPRAETLPPALIARAILDCPPRSRAEAWPGFEELPLSFDTLPLSLCKVTVATPLPPTGVTPSGA
mmetsp:Transcript_5861/g.19458  ORF Transcript_5861/g.19458 Transcript_5861/m.19458 type:complete len:330 (+) Transcript_5861:624-1613(+)